MIPSLPLGGRYCIVASDARAKCEARVISDLLRVDREKPIHEITMRFVEGVALTVNAVLPSGKPAPGVPVRLSYQTPYHHGFAGVTRRTDAQGRVTFKHVNPAMPGSYRVHVPSRRDYRPVSMDVEPRAPSGSVTIRLQRGCLVRGRLIDEATGRPVPGAEVYAISPGGAPVEVLEAEAATGDGGEFGFSNMGARGYNLYARGLRLTGDRRVIPAPGESGVEPRPGAAGGTWVELRGRILPGSRLKPSP